MNRMLRLGTLMLVATMLLLPGSAAQAQMNSPDFFLSVKVSGEDEVQLKWMPPPGVAVEYYLVFRAALDSGMMTHVDPADFTQIDSTSDTAMSDHPPLDQSRVFAYLVTAHAAGGVDLRSNISVANFLNYGGGYDWIKIISDPPLRAEVGELYQYQVVAVSSNSAATLSYFLHRGPEGMVMSPTGLVTWTPGPSQIGWHRVEIRVESSSGGHREQEYFILVGGGNGVVQGHVRDTSGAPIARVMVKLYQRNRDRHFEYRAITDMNGFYRISPVDPATYLVRAVPLRPDFIGQWYNGVRHVWEATPVTVPDTSVGVTVVNFVLRSSFSTRPHFTVSGTVTDDQGAPLAEAWVLFARPEFCFNASLNEDNGFEDGGYDRDAFDWKNFPNQWRFDHRIDGLSKWIFRVQTDVNGNYSIRLPQGKYISLALKHGYTPIFFDGKTDFLTADVIALSSDTSGIDFALPVLPPVPLGEISGAVTDVISGDPVPSRMIAFRDRWSITTAMNYGGTYFTDTDSVGAYVFENLPPGKYYVLALPLGSYIPSFYSITGPTIRWSQATPINILGNSVAGIDIAVKPMPHWAFGYTWIYGHVFANQLVGGSAAGKSQSVALPGAMVYATDAQGNVTGYGITGPDGSYQIASIAPGSYTVVADLPGYQSASGSASPTYNGALDPTPGSATLNITLTALEGPGSVPSGFSLEQNYPNPFNPSTTITFTVPTTGQVTVAIYNIIGQEVVQLVNNVVPAGTYQVSWDGKDAHGRAMTSGVYLYRITADQYTATRKMLMVK